MRTLESSERFESQKYSPQIPRGGGVDVVARAAEVLSGEAEQVGMVMVNGAEAVTVVVISTTCFNVNNAQILDVVIATSKLCPSYTTESAQP